MVYPYSSILLNNRNGCVLIHTTTWSARQTEKECALYDFIYMKFKNRLR